MNKAFMDIKNLWKDPASEHWILILEMLRRMIKLLKLFIYSFTRSKVLIVSHVAGHFWRIGTPQRNLAHHQFLQRVSMQMFSHISSIVSLANGVSVSSPLFPIQSMLLVSIAGVP